MAKKPKKLKKIPVSSIPKDLGVTRRSSMLQGKKIALDIGGGIGATEAVKIAREIRRQGAVVKAFLSPQALRFITPLSVEWATLAKPVIEAGPQVEYLEEFDSVLVAPTTLHILSKSALGLTDTVVDLLIANQLGSQRKVFMVPAMNIQLWDHPLRESYQKSLESWGVAFFPFKEEENRLKVPDARSLVEWMSRELSRDKQKGI